MIIGGVTYALVVASNFSHQSYVQIIANLLVGVGAAMLWNAEGVYIGRCAVWDSRTSTKSFAETTSSFNGVFYSIFQFSGCAGTLIGGLITQFFKDKPNVLFLPLFHVASLHCDDDCGLSVRVDPLRPPQRPGLHGWRYSCRERRCGRVGPR